MFNFPLTDSYSYNNLSIIFLSVSLLITFIQIIGYRPPLILNLFSSKFFLVQGGFFSLNYQNFSHEQYKITYYELNEIFYIY